MSSKLRVFCADLKTLQTLLFLKLKPRGFMRNNTLQSLKCLLSSNPLSVPIPGQPDPTRPAALADGLIGAF